MFNSLLYVVDSMGESVILDKGKILQNVETILNNITDNIVPMLDDIINNKDLFEHLKDNTVIHNLLQSIDRGNGVIATVEKIKKFFLSVKESDVEIKNTIENIGLDNVTNKTLTAKYGVLIRMLNDISSLTIVTLDIFKLAFDSSIELSKDQIERLNYGVSMYGVIFNTYEGNIENILTTIPEVSGSSIYELNQNSNAMGEQFLKNTGKMINLPDNQGYYAVEGSELYKLPVWDDDADIAAKVEYSEFVKKISSYKLTALKLAQDGSTDGNLATQIDILENRLNELEYKIVTKMDITDV